MQSNNFETKLDQQFLEYEKLAEIADYLFDSAIQEIGEHYSRRIMIEPLAKTRIKANRVYAKQLYAEIKSKIKASSTERVLITESFIIQTIHDYNESRRGPSIDESQYHSKDVIGLLNRMEAVAFNIRRTNVSIKITIVDIAKVLFEQQFFIKEARNEGVMRVHLQNVLTFHDLEIKSIEGSELRWPTLSTITTFRKKFKAGSLPSY